ncbi:hypothetical protein HED51_19670 [Ochrobactrum grignonense]|nr:hypothetical protein [Brucella grignonensis]
MQPQNRVFVLARFLEGDLGIAMQAQETESRPDQGARIRNQSIRPISQQGFSPFKLFLGAVATIPQDNQKHPKICVANGALTTGEPQKS